MIDSISNNTPPYKPAVKPVDPVLEADNNTEANPEFELWTQESEENTGSVSSQKEASAWQIWMTLECFTAEALALREIEDNLLEKIHPKK